MRKISIWRATASRWFRSRALYGFERTGDISREPAAVIARAAQNFGQTDDITVVTVDLVGSPHPVHA